VSNKKQIPPGLTHKDLLDALECLDQEILQGFPEGIHSPTTCFIHLITKYCTIKSKCPKSILNYFILITLRCRGVACHDCYLFYKNIDLLFAELDNHFYQEEIGGNSDE
jgi:hypothetical protein